MNVFLMPVNHWGFLKIIFRRICPTYRLLAREAKPAVVSALGFYDKSMLYRSPDVTKCLILSVEQFLLLA